MSYEQQQSSDLSTTLTDSVDSMMGLLLRMTEGTVDFMVDGMRWMTDATVNGLRRMGPNNGRNTSGSDRWESTTYTDADRGTTSRTSSRSNSASRSSSNGG